MLQARVVAQAGRRITFEWCADVGLAGDPHQFTISVPVIEDYPVGQHVVVVPVPDDWQDRVLVRYLKRRLR